MATTAPPPTPPHAPPLRTFPRLPVILPRIIFACQLQEHAAADGRQRQANASAAARARQKTGAWLHHRALPARSMDDRTGQGRLHRERRALLPLLLLLAHVASAAVSSRRRICESFTAFESRSPNPGW